MDPAMHYPQDILRDWVHRTLRQIYQFQRFASVGESRSAGSLLASHQRGFRSIRGER